MWLPENHWSGFWGPPSAEALRTWPEPLSGPLASSLAARHLCHTPILRWELEDLLCQQLPLQLHFQVCALLLRHSGVRFPVRKLGNVRKPARLHAPQRLVAETHGFGSTQMMEALVSQAQHQPWKLSSPFPSYSGGCSGQESVPTQLPAEVKMHL